MSATVYIPDKKITAFVQKIEQYLTKSTPKKGLPKNQTLVESISEIRAALLEALWTDALHLLPPMGQAIWWEVWLRKTENPDEALNEFRQHTNLTGLQVGSVDLQFPERTVVLVFGTRERMMRSLELLSLIAEIRFARINPEDFMELSAVEQAGWVEDLSQRTRPPEQTAPAVCLLDTGVNREHPLLRIALAESDCHSHHPDWGTADHDGHGTEMGGLALYGDLAEALATSSEQILTHCLESVKILPPPGFPPNEPSLYGAVTEQAVSRAEIQAPTRRRVVCMPVSVSGPENVQPSARLSESERQNLLDQINEFRGRGRPSSWSAAIDKITSGAEDDHRRLIVLAAGNTEREFRRYYPDSNRTEGIHDPGQSWNALTVGAYTVKTEINNSTYPGWQPIAPPGDLSPASTTSLVWQEQWPLKPDICMEGGNMATDPATRSPDYVDSLQLLTTHRDLLQRLFTTTGDTSAATALTARMAAIIQAEYPEFWPETIRA
ncbi:MAG: S8 family peptidase, partial [Deltaproteobacteria bacterium]|nr:S8 family peptidase [Deltaproteobacteria bacterium]